MVRILWNIDVEIAAVTPQQSTVLATACKSGADPDLPHQVGLQRKVTVLLPFELATMVECISGEP